MTGSAPGTLTSVSIELYKDPGPPSTTVALYADNGSGHAPGNWIANLGSVLDTSLAPGDNVYTFPASGIPLSGSTLYWIVVSSTTGSIAQWDYETGNAGLSVAGHGYYSATLGYEDNSTGAYIMKVNTGDGNDFDSLSPQYGGGTVFSSDGVAHEPLGASWRTGAAPGSLKSVSLKLYDPLQTQPTTPLPSTALLLGTGLAGLLGWRLRAKAARRAIAIALPLAAALALALPARAQPPRAVTHTVSQDEINETLAYWTPERMASAIPMPMPMLTNADTPPLPERRRSGLRSADDTPTPTPGFDPAVLPLNLTRDGVLEPHEPEYPAPVGDCTDCTGNQCNPYQSTFYLPPAYYATAYSNLPYRAIGKVFFLMEGRNFVCSAASIGGNAVITAGHCVSDGAGNFDTNWLFIPEFWNYSTNFVGPWVATKLMTFDAFLNNMDISRDVGFAILSPPLDLTLSETVGALGFAWNQDPTGLEWNAFGYPMINYDGVEIVQTDATTACRNPGFTPPSVGIGSGIKSGGSGGPWVLDFRPSLVNTNVNYVGGVNSYVNPVGNQLFSPYFDQAVKDLKDQAVAATP
jgi:hypothetical protein